MKDKLFNDFKIIKNAVETKRAYTHRLMKLIQKLLVRKMLIKLMK